MTSPPKSDSVLTSAEALAVAVWPGLAEADATDGPQEITSALGYAEALPNETASFGAETTVVVAPPIPGTTTRTAKACAVAPPFRDADSAPARPGASATETRARAMSSRLPTKLRILAHAAACPTTRRPVAVNENRSRYGGRVELPAPLRLTRQRQAILDAIEAQRGAFAVADVYERARRAAPRLGLATVYRTVEVLREAGSIRPLTGAGDGIYVRCHPGHHHHLVCVSCGSVEETELCGAPSPDVLRRRHGFQAQSHELEVYGTCGDCS